METISPRQGSKERGHSLSLCSLTPAGSRANHLHDGIGSKRGKSLCGRAGGELVDDLFHLSEQTAGLDFYHGTDVGVPVEDLVDGDEVRIPSILTAEMLKVGSRWWEAVETMRTQFFRRKGRGDLEPCLRDSQESPWRPYQCRYLRRKALVAT